MVSDLSARLLRGHKITFTSASARSEKQASTSDLSSSNSSTNSASQSNRETFDSVQQEGSPSSRSSRYTSSDACFKRRKIDELRFAASMVKEDLARGGLPFPSIHSKKPRALEGFDIDMSSIRLLGAKSVADSPFLTKVALKRPLQSMCAYDQLFSEAQQVYNKQSSQGEDQDWGDKSSTTSLSSDSEASCVVDIPPLLDDALKSKSSESESREASTLSLNTISMGAALETCNEPRLMTLSFAPFLIIHANAAYTRMTGLGAKDVLGKPFREVFKDKRCKSMAASFSCLANMHEQLTSVSTSRQDKRCHCTLMISLVGATNELDPSSATHCLVALVPTNQETPNVTASQPIVMATPGGHSMVMG